MAPEQARAEKALSTAVDVYSLGAILYELLTCQPPFKAATTLDTILQVLESEPADPRLLNPKANRDLSAIGLKCLAKDPVWRYGSAAEMADDLERWARGEPTRARVPNLAELAWRWLQRNAVGAAAVLAIGLTWGLTAALFVAVRFSTTEGLRSRNVTPIIREVRPIGTKAGTTGPISYDESMGSSAIDLRFWPQSLLHPLGWARLAAEHRIVNAGAIVAAIGLTITAGRIAGRAVRPRDARGALATAAVTGLVAFVAAFFYLTPFAVNEFADYDPRLTLHPIKPQNMPVDGRKKRITWIDSYRGSKCRFRKNHLNVLTNVFDCVAKPLPRIGSIWDSKCLGQSPCSLWACSRQNRADKFNLV